MSSQRLRRQTTVTGSLEQPARRLQSTYSSEFRLRNRNSVAGPSSRHNTDVLLREKLRLEQELVKAQKLLEVQRSSSQLLKAEYKILYQRWMKSQEHREELEKRLKATQEHRETLKMVLEAAQPSLAIGLFLAPHPWEVLRVLRPELYNTIRYLGIALNTIISCAKACKEQLSQIAYASICSINISVVLDDGHNWFRYIAANMTFLTHLLAWKNAIWVASKIIWYPLLLWWLRYLFGNYTQPLVDFSHCDRHVHTENLERAKILLT